MNFWSAISIAPIPVGEGMGERGIWEVGSGPKVVGEDVGGRTAETAGERKRL